MANDRFPGKVVLVTGARGGFGARIAERLAAEGALLLLSDLGAEPGARLSPLVESGARYLAGDVADEAFHETLVRAALDAFGRLDIAINNAGVVHPMAKLAQIDAAEARRIVDIDLMGVFYAMKHQLPVMERQFRASGKGGAIVNLASVAGLGAAPRLSVYAAAKHGVVGLTRSAAVEYATKGIRVNAVCPSYARTPMAEDFIRQFPEDQRAAAEAEMARGIPMKRLAEVEEVVEAVLFAADPANSFMTGQSIAVDGGLQAL